MSIGNEIDVRLKYQVRHRPKNLIGDSIASPGRSAARLTAFTAVLTKVQSAAERTALAVLIPDDDLYDGRAQLGRCAHRVGERR